MVEETSKIREYIDSERERLGRDFDEIEDRVRTVTDRVRTATDMKTQFNTKTGWFIAAAVTGGFIAARVFRKSETKTPADEGSRVHRRSKHLDHVAQTIDSIFDGLVAVVSHQMSEFVAEAVPGFRERYRASASRGAER